MAGHFENMTFLFAGKLKSMKREEAVAKVEALGGKCVSGVSKSLSVLVATSETSAKTKAQELNSKGANIQLWTEEQFMAELEKAEASSKVKAGGKKPHTNTGADAAKATKTASKPKLTAKQLEKLNKDLLKAVDNSKPSIEIIKSLIDTGADVNAKGNKGRTPLHLCKKADVAKLIIDAGADINAKDNNGKTPLYYCEDTDIAKMLIEAGADVNAKDNHGKTLLHFCEDERIAISQTDIVKMLIDAGADVNAKDDYGNTPLHLTDISADIAQVLINAGADVNASNNGGKTPLHWCYFAKTAQVFIDAGADVNAKDEDGNTPLHYCEHYDVAKVLVDAGADVNAENNDGETPLDHGVDLWEDEDIEDLLVNAGAVRHKDVDDEEDVDDERILELVKKHLADAAPNSMVHIEIINKLKEDGLPATMPFTARFNDLMSGWVKKGIIVRVERGVYKLAELNNNTEN